MAAVRGVMAASISNSTSMSGLAATSGENGTSTGITDRVCAMPVIIGQCGVSRISSSPGSSNAPMAQDSAWVAPQVTCTPPGSTGILFRVLTLSAMTSSNGPHPAGGA